MHIFFNKDVLSLQDTQEWGGLHSAEKPGKEGLPSSNGVWHRPGWLRNQGRLAI